MAQGISLLVGLGNPGAEYAETRHNAGFRFLDALLVGTGVSLKHESRFHGEVGRFAVAGRDLWLLKPMAFMNHSGESVAKLARFYKIPPAEILVVHDDLDIPPGSARLKVGGGDGGHNGLADVTEKLGTPDYVRLRLGIGHPGSAAQVVAYVLKKAPKPEQSLIDEAIERARAYLNDIVQGEFQHAMNALHAHPR
ncbi:MAG: aminoacyl-tRNA hydrolase [Pseudomonadota bacterium]